MPKAKTIDEIRQIIKKHGGELLSNEYKNSNTELKIKCKNNHIWVTRYINLCAGTWCRVCAGKKHSLEEASKMAFEREGKCLSIQYTDIRDKLLWECKHGHQWEASFSSIKKGKKETWCPICFPRTKTIEYAKQIILERNGELLNGTYKNMCSVLEVKCEKGHIWKTNYKNLKSNHWCKVCAGSKLTLEDAQQIAFKRDGKCLSTVYVNNSGPLLWECRYGHQWKATLGAVRTGNKGKGSWCPECASGLYERICRKYLETIFNKSFPKVRPIWLINDNNNRLELDGYCEELGVAFEHNGTQHYDSETYFKEDFNGRKRNDECKLQLCQQYNVKIIIIPELFTIMKLDNLKDFIKSEFIRLNIEIPKSFDDISINDMGLYSSKIDEFKELAIKKGGKLLSTKYLGNSKKLLWQCVFGHKWMAQPSSIKIGSWCPKCHFKKIGENFQKYTIEDMQEIAKKHGGKCLSEKYSHKEKLVWQCSCGNIWKAIPSPIIYRNSWCPKCSKLIIGKLSLKYNISDMYKIAEDNGGKCLSKAYYSNHKLIWQCLLGHIWKANFYNILYNKSWCPICAGRKQESYSLKLEDVLREEVLE